MFLSSIVVSPVKANLVPEIKSESLTQIDINSQDDLMSQLRGHDVYDAKPQIEWNGYMLGRVVGKAGKILFVKLPDGTYFNDVGEGYPGVDVLVEQVNGRYKIAGIAHSGWISILESKYGWRKIADSSGSLNERTAAIWRELDSNSSSSNSSISIPPRTSTPSYTPVQSPIMNEPIRGLY